MATASAAHLRDIAVPLTPVHPTTPRASRPSITGSSAATPGKNASLLAQTGAPVLPALPQEDRDAALTGSTRSLARRLFALNLHAQAAQPIPAAPHRPALAQLRSA